MAYCLKSLIHNSKVLSPIHCTELKSKSKTKRSLIWLTTKLAKARNEVKKSCEKGWVAAIKEKKIALYSGLRLFSGQESIGL